MSYQLINASAHDTGLPAKSVHCVVTSPPYFGLRSYAGEQDVEWPVVEYAPMAGMPSITIPGCDPNCRHEWVELSTKKVGRNDETPEAIQRRFEQYGTGRLKALTTPNTTVGSGGAYCIHCGGMRCALGAESSPEAFIGHLILVMREMHRVLRDDGLIFWNLGDSYWGGKGQSGYELPHEADARRAKGGTLQRSSNVPGYKPMRPTDGKHPGIKPKDLVMIPARFALAAQADGWYLRSDLIWHKPNPMPESVTDRCTKAHEYIYMLAKSEKYYFDADAISEASEHLNLVGKSQKVSYHDESAMRNDGNRVVIRSATRNKRSVWKIATQPYAGSHFATFPIELPLTCIKAGTSEHGVCAKCQAPYERVTEKTMPPLRKVKTNGPVGGHGLLGGNRFDEPIVTVTTGWQATCTCDAGEAIPATVLDPFNGSGTSGRAAMQLNRSYIGLDICQSYLEDLAPARMSNVQIEMALA